MKFTYEELVPGDVYVNHFSEISGPWLVVEVEDGYSNAFLKLRLVDLEDQYEFVFEADPRKNVTVINR